MIGVIIVSYRSDDLTVRFVREELSRISLPYAVVVVDNGATQAEADALASRLPGVAVLAAENRGFAAGNNMGVRYLTERVHPEYILLTNNDISLSEGVVEELEKTLKAHPEAGIAGPEVVGLDGRRQGPYSYLGLWDRYVWMYLMTPFLPREAKRRRFVLSYPEEAQAGPHYALTGSFLLADSAVYASVGGMDEATFLYAEENILSDRLSAVGKCFWFCPSVQVVHQHGRTIGSRYDARERAMLQFESMAYYYRRYRNVSKFSVALARWIFKAILRVR